MSVLDATIRVETQLYQVPKHIRAEILEKLGPYVGASKPVPTEIDEATQKVNIGLKQELIDLKEKAKKIPKKWREELFDNV